MSLAILVQQVQGSTLRTTIGTTWTTIPLTHNPVNEDSIVSNFTSGTFTLAAGTYRFELVGTFTGIGNSASTNYFLARLFNITDGVTAVSSPLDVSSAGAVDNNVVGATVTQLGSFTLVSPATFRVEAKASFTSTNTNAPKAGVAITSETVITTWLKVIKKQ